MTEITVPASNTRECFSSCIGKRVVAVLFDAIPMSRKDLAMGTKTLIFDDGTALTISARGTYWLEDPAEVKRAVAHAAEELKTAYNRIAEVLADK